MGLGALLFIFLFLNFKNNFKIIFLISFYILLGYFLGQPSSRFFLEPFIWVILTLSNQKIKFNIEKITYNILRIQYILFLPAILFGAASIFPGNLNVNLILKVLEKNANGYSLYRWANSEFEKLNYKGPIITTHRSISYAKNLPISNDFIFTKINEIKFKKYADEIMSLNPSTFFRIQKQQITNIFQIVILLWLQSIKTLDDMHQESHFLEGNNMMDIYFQ